jgi:hypothetical protein
MPFTLIKGTFHVVNYSPDGDSIRFQPYDSALVHALSGSKPKFNARNHVQLRIEAIDSLETHFSPPSGGGSLHQPLELAHKASDRLLDFVRITNVQWDVARRTVLSANDGTRGYILSRTVEKNGRPVAFVYREETKEPDGKQVRLEAPRLRDSYNFQAVLEGLAYPTYYYGLFNDLRETLTAAVEEARSKKAGVYAIDRTTDGFTAASLLDITHTHAILPKLFRRLSEYMVNYGTAVGFKKKLEQSQEPVLDLRTSNFTHFDTFVEQEENGVHIRLSRRPEELVFDAMPVRAINHFSALMGNEVISPDNLIPTLILPRGLLPSL